MTILAERVRRIKPSPTLAVTKKAAELRAAGEDVIGLGAGEPDFDTPDTVKKAAIAAISEGFTKYTAVGGTAELKRAICDKFRRDNGLSYGENEVVVGTGGKQVLFNCLMATVAAGDEVVIPAPYWVSYPDMVLLAGGKPVVVACSADDNFKLTPQALARVITEKSKWLILNSPGNPTGSVYSPEELRALLEVVASFDGLWVLSDDMYEHIRYDGVAFATPASVAPALRERVVTVNGVSKAYAMTGWRIGYAGGPVEVIAAMTKIQSQSTSNPCSISQKAATAALSGEQGFIKERNAEFCRRRDFVVAALNAVEGLHCLKPQGAFYVFPSCRGVIGLKTPEGRVLGDDTDYASYLLESAKVAVVPGVAFGMGGFFRISYATSMEALREACGRIARATAVLSR